MLKWLTSKSFFIVLGPCLFLVANLIGGPADMSKPAFAVVACTLWIALWWLVEAVPIGITSLLPLLLFPFCGVMSVANVADYYSNPIIFLFIGGFIIALAMQKWNLHKRIALHIIRVSGTNQNQILLGFIMATGFLSMWISNTATTMMMLPIALSIIGQLSALSDRDAENGFGKALILSIAFSASIGGMATLVGTPTTLIFVEGVRDFYDVDVPFSDWFFFATPLVVLLGAFLWWHLGSNAFKLSRKSSMGSKAVVDNELQLLGKMKYEEKWILLIFSLVAIAWISRQYLIKPFFPQVTDTSIALIGAFILFVIPSRQNEKQMIMDWGTARKLPWAVILLFGGAFAVAGSFMESGLTEWIGQRLALLKDVPHWVILLVIIAVVNYLTELTQNMATCTLMLPILAGLAFTMGVHPFALMVPMTIAASCAFMLPVATAPNAIVFGAGNLQIKDMVRAGWLLNVVSIVLITVYTYYLLPLIWNIDVSQFPAGWVN